MNNTAIMDGGAVAAMQGANVSIANTAFYGNSAFQGGALYMQVGIVCYITMLFERSLPHDVHAKANIHWRMCHMIDHWLQKHASRTFS